MKRIEKEIAAWIKPYTPIIGEPVIPFDLNERNKNPSVFYVRLTLPSHFERFALALHSFWIDEKFDEREIKIIHNHDEDFLGEGYTRINWNEFYQRKQLPFDLNTAILHTCELNYPFPQLGNELYPSIGCMDEEHLKALVFIAMYLYGDQEIEVFYVFLATIQLEDNLLYRGKISELLDFLKTVEQDVIATPSLIYPIAKNWMISTDVDLAFSSIAGESKFINLLTQQLPNEIIEVVI